MKDRAVQNLTALALHAASAGADQTPQQTFRSPQQENRPAYIQHSEYNPLDFDPIEVLRRNTREEIRSDGAAQSNPETLAEIVRFNDENLMEMVNELRTTPRQLPEVLATLQNSEKLSLFPGEELHIDIIFLLEDAAQPAAISQSEGPKIVIGEELNQASLTVTLNSDKTALLSWAKAGDQKHFTLQPGQTVTDHELQAIFSSLPEDILPTVSIEFRQAQDEWKKTPQFDKLVQFLKIQEDFRSSTLLISQDISVVSTPDGSQPTLQSNFYVVNPDNDLDIHVRMTRTQDENGAEEQNYGIELGYDPNTETYDLMEYLYNVTPGGPNYDFLELLYSDLENSYLMISQPAQIRPGFSH